jgi:hypothetical protein
MGINERKYRHGFGRKTCQRETTQKTSGGGGGGLKWTLKKYSGTVWAGFFWVWIETSGRLLCIQS